MTNFGALDDIYPKFRKQSYFIVKIGVRACIYLKNLYHGTNIVKKVRPED
jgi:hypothetical protein